MALAYNKRVRRKSFEEMELVLKVVLPIGSKDRELGKWSLIGDFVLYKMYTSLRASARVTSSNIMKV